MQIEGVPDTIPRAKFAAMVRELGLDPADVHEFSVSRQGITAEVLARKDGELYANGDEVAVHRVFILFEND